MNEGNTVKQMTAAEEVKEFCERIRDKANDLNKFTSDKLNPYYVSVPPGLEKQKDARNYPEYFSILRTALSSIDTALDETRTTIQRADL